MKTLFYQQGMTKDGNWFLVLDGALREDIRQVLYTYSPDIDWLSLYQDTELESLIRLSPMLIPVYEEDPILQWYLDNSNQSQNGICIYAKASVNIIRTHLQSILLTYIHNEKNLFRFYDSIVLKDLQIYLTPYEKERMLGPAELWCWPVQDDDEKWSMIRLEDSDRSFTEAYNEKPNILQRTSLALSAGTIKGFEGQRETVFIEKIGQSLLKTGGKYDPEQFRVEAHKAIQQGKAYGLTYESTLASFVLFWMTVSTEFHMKPAVNFILRNASYHELEKIQLTMEELF
jgi:hypothetical protein